MNMLVEMFHKYMAYAHFRQENIVARDRTKQKSIYVTATHKHRQDWHFF